MHELVYSVSAPWSAVCITSCLVLWAIRVPGVFFTYINDGPELLGHVSTILRDYRYLEVPTTMDGLDEAEVSKLIRETPCRYGIYQSGGRGEEDIRLGIRREDEIVPLRERGGL